MRMPQVESRTLSAPALPVKPANPERPPRIAGGCRRPFARTPDVPEPVNAVCAASGIALGQVGCGSTRWVSRAGTPPLAPPHYGAGPSFFSCAISSASRDFGPMPSTKTILSAGIAIHCGPCQSVLLRLTSWLLGAVAPGVASDCT